MPHEPTHYRGLAPESWRIVRRPLWVRLAAQHLQDPRTEPGRLFVVVVVRTVPVPPEARASLGPFEPVRLLVLRHLPEVRRLLPGLASFGSHGPILPEAAAGPQKEYENDTCQF
jgi:hypothetical protein